VKQWRIKLVINEEGLMVGTPEEEKIEDVVNFLKDMVGVSNVECEEVSAELQAEGCGA
jgi:pantothenate kinase